MRAFPLLTLLLLVPATLPGRALGHGPAKGDVPAEATSKGAEDTRTAGPGSHAQDGGQPTFTVEDFLSAGNEPGLDPVEPVITGCGFGAMKRPKRLRGADPRYTKEALAARIEGLVIVKCRITLKGEVKNCRVVKPLPPLDTVLVQALEASRYEPVEYKGKPIEVDYTFNYRFKLPPPASAPQPDPAKR